MPDITPACPRCAHPLVRSRRTLVERQWRGHRRWRCKHPGCGWAGLLPLAVTGLTAPPGQADPSAPRSAPWSALRSAVRPTLDAVTALARRARPQPRQALAVAAAGLLVAAATAWMLRPAAVEAVMVGSNVVHRGTHLEGERLAPDHPLHSLLPAQTMEDEPRGLTEAAGATLRVRRFCAWGLPGRNPYRGSAAQALQTATLSPTVVKQIAADIKAGRRVDRVHIGNAVIRAERSGREFDPQRMALTYGMTLCVDARVNFPAGHSEGADLYEAMDDDGRIYAVMVPDVCGNVSVLGQRYVRQAAPAAKTARSDRGGSGERGGSGGTTAGQAAATTGDPRPWMLVPPEQRIRQLPDGLRYADRGGDTDGGRRDTDGQSVNTPGSLALSGLALVALWLVRRLRARSSDG